MQVSITYAECTTHQAVLSIMFDQVQRGCLFIYIHASKDMPQGSFRISREFLKVLALFHPVEMEVSIKGNEFKLANDRLVDRPSLKFNYAPLIQQFGLSRGSLLEHKSSMINPSLMASASLTILVFGDSVEKQYLVLMCSINLNQVVSIGVGSSQGKKII